MATEVDQATRLLPDQPGWTTEPASLSELMGGTALQRVYERGRTQAVVRVTAGPPAGVAVATMMNFPISDPANGASGTWLLRGCKAHVVQTSGSVHSLGVILRGGPGDLPGSVMLEVTGRHLPYAAAAGLALCLDWDAIRAELADRYPMDHRRIAAARDPAPVLDAQDKPLRLWPMSPSVASMVQMDKLRRRRPPRFALVNDDAIHAAQSAVGEWPPSLGGQDRDRHYFAAIPTPHLVITHGQFAPDYLWPGITMAFSIGGASALRRSSLPGGTRPASHPSPGTLPPGSLQPLPEAYNRALRTGSLALSGVLVNGASFAIATALNMDGASDDLIGSPWPAVIPLLLVASTGVLVIRGKRALTRHHDAAPRTLRQGLLVGAASTSLLLGLLWVWPLPAGLRGAFSIFMAPMAMAAAWGARDARGKLSDICTGSGDRR